MNGQCTMSMCTCTTTCLLYVQVEWSESPLPCNQIFLHVHVYTPCTCLIGYVLHIPRLSLHISFTCIGHTHAALLLSDLQKKNFSCRAQHIPQVFCNRSVELRQLCTNTKTKLALCKLFHVCTYVHAHVHVLVVTFNIGCTLYIHIPCSTCTCTMC